MIEGEKQLARARHVLLLRAEVTENGGKRLNTTPHELRIVR